ncbi:MAG: DUF2809 domain-containing protein [Flavobacteriaceae bacterium]|nr:DUF2809 domain-containing protein [Flavobacteriaceae bacterium]
MRFNKNYFKIFVLILLIEVCIATFLKSGFIRHTFGDFLVVIMLYCFIKSFINLKPLLAAWIVLIFATGIEIGQFFNVLDRFDLRANPLANLVLGNTFSYSDLIAYTLGIITVIIVENKFSKRPE